MKVTTDYHGFCFSQPGKELGVTNLVEDDFALFLSAYAKTNGMDTILMDLQSRCTMRYGVEQLLKEGLKIVVMDPDYSPIVHDAQLGVKVLPVDVARSWPQFEKMHPRAVITSAKHIERFVQCRALSMMKAYFVPGTGDHQIKIMGRSGWYVSSSSVNVKEGKEIVNNRVYRYSAERDYEIVRKK